MSDDANNHPLDAQDGNEPEFLVVGIGASAGGISALRRLFSRVTPDGSSAFVVILHLSPAHESNLAAIIQTETALRVMQVNEMVRIEPDHIYVNPPSKYLVVEGGYLKLAEPERLHGGHTSIDLFLRCLGDAYPHNSVAIILSGTGADGTLGLQRIKEQGGFVIAQLPEEAEYDGMPLSAIDTGLVDLIMPVAEMAEKIRSLHRVRHPSPFSAEDGEPLFETDSPEINEILTLVRQRTGHDFTQYKRPTLLRRIARRLQVHTLPDLESYLNFLRAHADETKALLRDLLSA
jgi:two-component system, chemotaxis family, CheB/CheR fusion protein